MKRITDDFEEFGGCEELEAHLFYNDIGKHNVKKYFKLAKKVNLNHYKYI